MLFYTKNFLGAQCEYLLSASALVMLAVADLGQECEELLLRSCVVTETTRSLLAREAELFRGQIDRSAGALYLDANGKPVLVPMEEDERRARRVFVAKILDLLDRIQTCVEDEGSQANHDTPRKMHVGIGANEARDWIVCERRGMTYVTEDTLEAVRIAAGKTMKWCTLLQMVGAIGLSDQELSLCSVRMHRAGCDPSMGRSQALRVLDLIDKGRSLDEDELNTLLNYMEATGSLDNRGGDSQDHA